MSRQGRVPFRRHHMSRRARLVVSSIHEDSARYIAVAIAQSSQRFILELQRLL